MAVPTQSRSVDPWSENRFSNNYNLRSRILTRGIDAVLYQESFDVIKSTDTSIIIKPGLAVKDDVLIHILEDATANMLTDEVYMIPEEVEPPINVLIGTYIVHLVLEYVYARSMPAPAARYKLLRDVANFNTVKFMWLAGIKITDGIIVSIYKEGVRIPDVVGGTVLSRRTIHPINGYARINGGVIRPDTTGGTVDWYSEWNYI